MTVESYESDIRFYSTDVLVGQVGSRSITSVEGGGVARDRAYNLSGHSKMHIPSCI